MPFCTQCGEKSTMQNRLKDNVCRACRDKGDDGVEESDVDVNIDEDTTMNEIRFGDLKNWFKTELRSSIKDIVKQEMTTQLDEIKKEIKEVKKVSHETEKTAASNSTKVANLEEELKTLKTTQKEEAAISRNNLKYLINLDRNERRQNIIMFGVPEDELVLNGKTTVTVIEKIA